MRTDRRLTCQPDQPDLHRCRDQAKQPPNPSKADIAYQTLRNASRPAGQGRVHASYWWITEDGTYLGAITLRHELDNFLLRAGGHIGCGIRSSARGRGLATWALQSVLVRAPVLGLRKVLVTCGDSNLASARVIEKAGGVLEDVRETELGLTRRYWITL